jgi:PTH1 family peptidyl-tRNA hydrolase
MRLIVGLGNPGERYAMTPHNLGFLVIDELAQTLGISIQRPEAESLAGMGRLGREEVVLAKPQTYMNLSGRAVKKLMERWELTPRELLVVVDDLDLPWGQIRIRERGSAGTHNGMRSIVETIDGNEFVRVRMGIQPDHPVNDAAAFVLSPFVTRQHGAVDEFVARGAQAVLAVLHDGVIAAMNQFNALPAGAGSGSNESEG